MLQLLQETSGATNADATAARDSDATNADATAARDSGATNADATAARTSGATNADATANGNAAATMAGAPYANTGSEYMRIVNAVEEDSTIQGAIAIGYNSEIQSTVLNEGTTEEPVLVPYAADNSIALGTGATIEAKGEDGIAIGREARVTGKGGIAIGATARAIGENTIAIGVGAVAEEGGVAIGTNAVAKENQVVIGGPGDVVIISGVGNVATEFEKVSAGIAMAMAMQAPAISPGKRTSLSIGAGFFNHESALAVSVGTRVNENWTINGSLAYTSYGSSERKTGGRIGATFEF